MRWQLQEAKQKFSELVQRALDEGPQVVTRRGEEVVVVVSAEEFRHLSGSVPDFKEFLLSAPDLDALELHRSEDRARVVELFHRRRMGTHERTRPDFHDRWVDGCHR